MNCCIYCYFNCVSRINILFIFIFFLKKFVCKYGKDNRKYGLLPFVLIDKTVTQACELIQIVYKFHPSSRGIMYRFFHSFWKTYSLLYQLLMLCNRKHWESSFSCVVLALSQNEVLQLLVHSNVSSSVSADLCKQSRPFRLL